MMNKFLIMLGILGIAILISCGGGGGGGTAINVAGNWQFNTVSTVFAGFGSTATGQVEQNGSSLSGTLDLSGTPCAQTANFTGSISGNKLSAKLDENGQNIALVGTIAADGNSGSGTYTAPVGGCTNGDAGTFIGQRLSMLNGTFVGSLGPVNSIRSNVVAQLGDDGGNVRGSATIMNSVCFHSLQLVGKVTGFNVELDGRDGDAPQTMTIHGTFDPREGSLPLTYSVADGDCSGETGTMQLHLIK